MDDLANRMRVSKRTLYQHIASKEELVGEIIDAVFADMRKNHQAIANDPEMDIIKRIKNVICVMPENFPNINYKKVYEIKRYYPELYKKIEYHLALEWETTHQLFQEGIRNHCIRDVNVNLIRQLILGTFRSLLDDEFLLMNDMTYEEALDQSMDMILKGLELTRE